MKYNVTIPDSTHASSRAIPSQIETRYGEYGIAAGQGGLVFTGGIVERSVERSDHVGADAVAPFADLGAALDPAKNAAAVTGKGDAEISAAGARARTLVIEAREDLSVLAEMRRALG